MPSDHLSESSTPPEVLSGISPFPPLVGKFDPTARVRNLYRRMQQSPAGFDVDRLLSEMRVELCVDDSDVSRIPARGSVVVVANHPYGMLDGALLTVLFTRVRPDVKILTNVLLADVPELRRHCIFVDPFQSDHSIASNRKAVREAIAWLEQGGMLVTFPGGEVSQWQMPAAQVADPAWSNTAVRLIRCTGASALPVYFCGHNGVGFQLLGMIHPKLRAAFSMQEFLKQEGKQVEVRVGSVIPADRIDSVAADPAATEYLRWRTYLLARRKRSQNASPLKWPETLRSQLAARMQEPIAPASDASALAQEIANLPAESLLVENPEFAVYLGKAAEIPQLLLEVGRLRELTFRRAGEGVGKARDLDSFDSYYWHILLWNKSKQELVGAYRAGSTVEILPQHGVAGLYTSTLFRYDERVFEKLGPALELGRSFIRPEYQRQYAPLLLLWKGIARLVAMHPEIPVLFGAVSISNDYSQASREMIYSFFESRNQNVQEDLRNWIEPRRPFRPAFLRRWDCRSMCRALRDLDELSEPITDIESDGKGLPILLRQYAKIGGKLLGFNVDRNFSNVLDGLVVVDLRQTDLPVLERYMGHAAAARFRQLHAPGSAD